MRFLFFTVFSLTFSYNCWAQRDVFSDWVSDPAPDNACKGYYAPPQSVHPTLRADEITLQATQAVTAKGHIGYFSPVLGIWGKEANYSNTPQSLQVDAVIYHWYPRQARGQAQRILVNHKNQVQLWNASYTTCSPFQETWLLKAKEIALFPNTGRATAKDITLTLHDIPIFYFPYLDYPIDGKRHSGFLFPNMGSTSNSGYELIIPYYWNSAPNYDMTFAGRWLSERGIEAQTKLRYLFSKSKGELEWFFLPRDRKYAHFTRQLALSPTDPRRRALYQNSRQAIQYRHQTDWSQKWQGQIVFDYVSDDNYFVDLRNDIQAASTLSLPQKAALTYYGRHWSHFFNIEEYQILQPLSKPPTEEVYKRQPQWSFLGHYQLKSLPINFGLMGEIVNFNHRPDIHTHLPLPTGQRLHFRPSVTFPIKKPGFFFVPRAQWDFLQYWLQHADFHQSHRAIPLYSLDSGLVFERTLAKKAYVQTIEPRLYYLYVPYRNQSHYPLLIAALLISVMHNCFETIDLAVAIA